MGLCWRVGTVLLLLAMSPAFGQVVVEASKVPEEWRDLQAHKGEPKLDCSVAPVKPQLNYSFRFQTGYVVHVPMRQYLGKGHWIATLVRVTPEEKERQPVYLSSNARLPEVPKTKQLIEFGGGFVVGEGKYLVEVIVTDNAGRVCREDWKIKAKLGRKEGGVPAGMPPGTVDEISLRKWTRGSKGPKDEQGRRVTVLMNVSPVFPRKVRLGGYDRVLLLSSLASLVERLPLRSMRLVLFSLDQQREIYRSDNFQAADFGRVAQALGRLELGTVDYEVLKNRRGHVDLISDLISESSKDDKSDAVVFLGPKPWYFDRVQRTALPERGPHDPPFFYIQFRPFMASASYTDTLMAAVKQMGGKTFDVYTPGDFAQAINGVTKALDEKR
jgi:hypothetical protein